MAGEGRDDGRRKSRTGPSPPRSIATTVPFLSRFIGSFKASDERSGSRPNLGRAQSSPTPSLSPPPPPAPTELGSLSGSAGLGLGHPIHLEDGPQGFRPDFRRASTSPTRRPKLSAVPDALASSSSRPSGLYRQGSQESQETGSVGMAKQDSTTSQRTLHAYDAKAQGSPSPLRRTESATFDGTTDAASAEQLLALISTLLQPALLLFWQLGPSNVLAPKYVRDATPTPSTHDTIDLPEEYNLNIVQPTPTLPRDPFSSSPSQVPGRPGQAPSGLPPPMQAIGSYTHELQTPCAMLVPAVSAQAVWRLMRGVEWLCEMMPWLTRLDSPFAQKAEESIFDMPATIQGIGDVLAAEATARGVELLISQMSRGRPSSPMATNNTNLHDPASRTPWETVTEDSKEALVKADERGWNVLLIWVAHEMLRACPAGSTFDLRLRSTHEQPSPVSAGQWRCTFEFEILPPSPPACRPDQVNVPSFDGPLTQRLLSYFDAVLERLPPGDLGQSMWTVSVRITSVASAAADETPASLLSRRRSSIEGGTQEPRLADLIKFVETSLRGFKTTVYAGENSRFASNMTAYFANWGMDVSHVPIETEESDSASLASVSDRSSIRHPFSRIDSGFGGSVPSEGTTPAAAPGEAPQQFIVIDEDLPTLRRIVQSLRGPSLQFPPTLVSKRPQLASRRTRSSPHVRQLHQIPQSLASTSAIVFFTPVTQFRIIREFVQEVIATTRLPQLPEIIIIPKPCGPRRILTALYTALKRPPTDPLMPPIATYPSTPGTSYWAPKISPALSSSNQAEFDFSAAPSSAVGPDGAPPTPGAAAGGRARTPPVYFPAPAMNHPPSPLAKISDEQVSYFSAVAETMEGSSPSEGMVVQSPNGRPAIFFQPTGRGHRPSASNAASSKPMEREDKPANEPSARPVATPHDIGLGQGARKVSPSTATSLSSDSSGSGMPLGTPALHLDSFITAAKSREMGEELASPFERELAPMSQRSLSSSSSNYGHVRRTSGSGHVSPKAGQDAQMGQHARTPSTSSPPGSPILKGIQTTTSPTSISGAAAREAAFAAAGNTSPREPQNGTSVSPAMAAKRRVSSVAGSGFPSKAARSRRNTARRTVQSTVPPVNVLIVEDNPINQAILSMFMKKKGIKYAVAKDGEEAVQKWKNGNFHLVLMDIQLPVKDGIEATREIRALERANNVGAFLQTPSTEPPSPFSKTGSSAASSAVSSAASSPLSPLSMSVIIVALTASSLQEDRVNALAAGCNDFLTKPVSLPWLQQKLLEWGSMAYLSGFSKKALNSPLSASVIGVPPPSTTEFSHSVESHPNLVAQRLHLDNNHRPAHPRTDLVHPQLPGLTIESPTPVDTPTGGTAAVLPPANTLSQQQVSAPNNEPAVDLDSVDQRLEESAKAVPTMSAAARLATLNEVAAEGARLVQLGQDRPHSDSLSQAIHDSEQPDGTAGQ